MGDVINLPRRAARESDTSTVLTGLLAQESSGELEGSIHIAATKHGTEFHVLGSCADRLQLGVLAMVKGLGIITDKIVATGTAGSTRSDSVVALWDSGLPRRRRMPRRLCEATKLGDLE
jgi:hypothetical protein